MYVWWKSRPQVEHLLNCVFYCVFYLFFTHKLVEHQKNPPNFGKFPKISLRFKSSFS
jgi:hypothetical protein